MNTFLIADTHFNHPNIILHCNRKPWLYPNPNYNPSKPKHFKFNNPLNVNIKAHDEALIENWNSMAKKEDHIYILGDFAFKNHNHFLMALNGHKYLIKGNHDKANQETYKNFTEVHEFGCHKQIMGYNITLCHYALRTWPGSYKGHSFLAYGHSHIRLPEFDNMLCGDVGVDGCGYGLWPFEVFLKKMQLKLEWINKNGKIPVDGENKAEGQYSKDPEQRVIETRNKNKEIFKSMGYPINEEMWT